MLNRKGGRGKTLGWLTVSSKEGDCSSLGAGTTSSTNTVDIILRIVRVVIVEYVSNVAHILRKEVSRQKSSGYSNVPA